MFVLIETCTGSIYIIFSQSVIHCLPLFRWFIAFLIFIQALSSSVFWMIHIYLYCHSLGNFVFGLGGWVGGPGAGRSIIGHSQHSCTYRQFLCTYGCMYIKEHWPAIPMSTGIAGNGKNCDAALPVENFSVVPKVSNEIKCYKISRGNLARMDEKARRVMWRRGVYKVYKHLRWSVGSFHIRLYTYTNITLGWIVCML